MTTPPAPFADQTTLQSGVDTDLRRWILSPATAPLPTGWEMLDEAWAMDYPSLEPVWVGLAIRRQGGTLVTVRPQACVARCGHGCAMCMQVRHTFFSLDDLHRCLDGEDHPRLSVARRARSMTTRVLTVAEDQTLR